ncbi:DUF4190 domain-containing protein [Isoptericola cucumis]|uniref:DUF4190 domain-containing protein n=1 Tax=Isoptericola cucumis TaxID=1776856 RepID=A0ABQ2B702_9MICO|nr:DUF4190 domain-containing protein [Isoptericola cucumis]GGI09546.1 hypothetical protein GCM10007368_26720 [Isoptericola cucumis]
MSQQHGADQHGYDPRSEPHTQVLPGQRDVPPPPADHTQVMSPAASDHTQVMSPAASDRTQVLPPHQQAPAPEATQVLPASAPERTQALPSRGTDAPFGGQTPPPAPRQDPWGAAQPYPQAQAPAPAPVHGARPGGDGYGQGGYGQGGHQPAPTPPREPARRGTEPTAVAALLFGLLGIVVPLVGILAIILGSIGRDRTRRRGTSGRGMATTGVVLGTIQLILTTLLVVGGLLFWNAYGDQIEAALDSASELAGTDISVPELLLGGITGDFSLDDLQELGGLVGNAGELQELGGQCQAGDAAACEDLLQNVPEDLIPENLPENLQDYLPSGS